MLYKVGLPLESVDENINCGHSNESYLAELDFPAVRTVDLFGRERVIFRF